MCMCNDAVHEITHNHGKSSKEKSEGPIFVYWCRPSTVVNVNKPNICICVKTLLTAGDW